MTVDLEINTEASHYNYSGSFQSFLILCNVCSGFFEESFGKNHAL